MDRLVLTNSFSLEFYIDRFLVHCSSISYVIDWLVSIQDINICNYTDDTIIYSQYGHFCTWKHGGRKAAWRLFEKHLNQASGHEGGLGYPPVKMLAPLAEA